MELFILLIGILLVGGFVYVLSQTESSAYASGLNDAKGNPKPFSDLPVGHQYRVLCDEELHKANAYVVWDGEKMLLVSSSEPLHDTFVVGKTRKGALVPNHCSI